MIEFLRGRDLKLLSAFLLALMLVGAASGFQLTDNDDSTMTDDFPAATFLGNTLTVFTFGGSIGDYTLANNSGSNEVVAKFNSSGKVETGNLSEGRYYINSTPVQNSSNPREIDILSNSSDVNGRIRAAEGHSSISPSEVNITLRHWLNLSLVDTSSNPDVNVTVETIPGLPSNEKIYRLNTTNLDKFWIAANASEQATRFKASRYSGEIPRTNDLRSRSVNTSFFGFTKGEGLMNVSNRSGRIVWENGTSEGIQGVKVRIRALGTGNSLVDRLPYIHKPPVRTDTTNSSGHFNFTNLPPGDYKIDIMNSSYTLTSGKFIESDFSVNATNKGKSAYTGEFSATVNVGGVNGSLNAPTGGDLRYGAMVVSESGNATYMVPGLKNGSFYLGNFPNGSYSVISFQFDTSSRSMEYNTEAEPGVNITEGKNVTIDFKFEPEVEFKGYVTGGSGRVANATVTARNRTTFSSDTATTGPKGKYSLELDNSTGYEVTVYPSQDSSLASNSTTIDVGAGSTSKNITLPQGAVLNGTVERSGSNVSGGFISVSNYDRNIYGSSRINSSGEYRITGLRNATTYQVDIYSRGSELETSHTVDTGAKEFDNHTFTVKSTSNGKIDGVINKSGGGTLDAVVTLSGGFGGVEKTNVTVNGQYSFSGMEQNTYYEIEVEPNSSSYPEREKFVYLGDENRTVNFTVEEATTLSGKVQLNNGTILEDASVYASNISQGSYSWDSSDADGSYSLELNPGVYEVSVYKRGYPVNVTTVKVPDGGKTQDINVSEGERLSGEIKKDGLVSDLNGTIGVWNSSQDSYGYTEFSFGNYSIDGLKDVSHSVWISIDSDTYSSQRKTIGKPNSSTDFNIVTNKGKSLKITVKNSTGPLKGALVTTLSRENTTNSNGVVTFPAQPTDEPVRISVAKPGYEGAVTKINVTEPSPNPGGGTDRVREKSFSLSKVNPLSVDINITKSGKAVQSASVIFSSNQTSVSQTASGITGSSGETSFEVPEGGYTVSLAVGEDNTYLNTTYLESGKSDILAMGTKYSLGYNVTE